jgi:hypothetical protein
MQQSVVKFYYFVVQTLLNMFRTLQCPSSGARQTAVAAFGFRINVQVEVFSAVAGRRTNRPRMRTLPTPHSYGNQRLQRQFDGLLMMGTIMPETCWAVSVRQSNKILRLIVASSWVFYLSDWRCTEPQTLQNIFFLLVLSSHPIFTFFYPFRISISSPNISSILPISNVRQLFSFLSPPPSFRPPVPVTVP